MSRPQLSVHLPLSRTINNSQKLALLQRTSLATSDIRRDCDERHVKMHARERRREEARTLLEWISALARATTLAAFQVEPSSAICALAWFVVEDGIVGEC